MKKVEVNKDLCIGCGACMQIDGETFGYDSDGLSMVLNNEVNEDNQNVDMACESCPTGAIKITDSCDKGCCGGDCHCGCHEGNECTCEK